MSLRGLCCPWQASTSPWQRLQPHALSHLLGHSKSHVVCNKYIAICYGSECEHAGLSGEAQTSYIIPPDTSVQTVVMADNIQRNCTLAVSADNDTVIRGVMLFAEQVRCRPSNTNVPCMLSNMQR